mgnify:FL=1
MNRADLQTEINARAESIIELLIAQCRDLELLLKLARREAAELERGDFAALMATVRERATLDERLAVYQQQIISLRAQLGQHSPDLESEQAAYLLQLAREIKEQDGRTRVALETVRRQTSERLARLQRATRGSRAYLQDGQTKPVACDRMV